MPNIYGTHTKMLGGLLLGALARRARAGHLFGPIPHPCALLLCLAPYPHHGGGGDRTLYADPPPPSWNLAGKCRTMGALRKICWIE